MQHQWTLACEFQTEQDTHDNTQKQLIINKYKNNINKYKNKYTNKIKTLQSLPTSFPTSLSPSLLKGVKFSSKISNKISNKLTDSSKKSTAMILSKIKIFVMQSKTLQKYKNLLPFSSPSLSKKYIPYNEINKNNNNICTNLINQSQLLSVKNVKENVTKISKKLFLPEMASMSFDLILKPNKKIKCLILENKIKKADKDLRVSEVVLRRCQLEYSMAKEKLLEVMTTFYFHFLMNVTALLTNRITH